MSGDFLDSNVILYAFDVDESKSETARRLLRRALGGVAQISFQVVQEVLSVLTRRSPESGLRDEPRRVLEDVLLPLWRGMPNEALYGRTLALQARYGFSFFDSHIIASALEGGCDRLYSEDLQAGQRIEGLMVVNPFTP